MTRPHRVRAVEALLNRERARRTHVVWNGDTFDTFIVDWSEEEYSYLLEPGDTLIRGNHDYKCQGLRQARIGNTLITHGDLLDFGYTFARLAALRRDPHLPGYTPVERFMARLRKWSPYDVYSLYDIQFTLTDAEAQAFQHPRPVAEWRKIITYTRLLRALLSAPLRPSPATLPDIPPLRPGGGYGGYFTLQPDDLMARALALYPTLRECDTLIIGHLHHPLDLHILCDDGKVRRLISLGAATDERATAAHVDDDGRVTRIEEF
ncbi:hypothetical protein IHN63_00210 [Deinococcus sp. 6YEL10]|nr:metallophosphoesterase [Deinococcus sp. 6YEL10]MCD0159721.1 hypothetical protein [Deinococcus sp. 6YEL10]